MFSLADSLSSFYFLSSPAPCLFYYGRRPYFSLFWGYFSGVWYGSRIACPQEWPLFHFGDDQQVDHHELLPSIPSSGSYLSSIPLVQQGNAVIASGEGTHYRPLSHKSAQPSASVMFSLHEVHVHVLKCKHARECLWKPENQIYLS